MHDIVDGTTNLECGFDAPVYDISSTTGCKEESNEPLRTHHIRLAKILTCLTPKSTPHGDVHQSGIDAEVVKPGDFLPLAEFPHPKKVSRI